MWIFYYMKTISHLSWLVYLAVVPPAVAAHMPCDAEASTGWWPLEWEPVCFYTKSILRLRSFCEHQKSPWVGASSPDLKTESEWGHEVIPGVSECLWCSHLRKLFSVIPTRLPPPSPALLRLHLLPCILSFVVSMFTFLLLLFLNLKKCLQAGSASL